MDRSAEKTSRFYDDIAAYYHLIFPNWQLSIQRQAAMLQKIINQRWDRTICTILDATCGIGTQSLALAQSGFKVTASDLSTAAVDRLRFEAVQMNLSIKSSVCDVRELHAHHAARFDLVISCDNSLPHLHPKTDLPLAVRQMYRCTSAGGGCLISLRDYAVEKFAPGDIHSYGVREVDGKRILAFQTRDYLDDYYNLSIYIVEESPGEPPTVRKFSSIYYPVTIDEVITMMRNAGFANIERIDDAFYQPVLVGDRID